MLETLRIKNFALIDEAEIPFQAGLNILSGETGAGKSIILDAISLLLGSRATTEQIRSGCEQSTVEGIFSVDSLPWLRERMAHFGFEPADGTLLIKRVIHCSGKHRVYVNGALATISILKDLCEGLVDLCGQHEHQSLLKPSVQLELLDRYGGFESNTKNVRTAFQTSARIKSELDKLKTSEEERSRRADYLKFQIEELKNADLKPGEDEILQEEKRLLQSSELRIQSAESIRGLFETDDQGILDSIRSASSKLRSLVEIDPTMASSLEGMDRAHAEVEEIAATLRKYSESIDLNPERLLEVQERLALIADFRRKYGSSIEAMLETLHSLEKEFQSIDQSKDKIETLENELQEAEAELYKLGKELSLLRSKAVKLLEDSVTQELKDLKMGDAKFFVELKSSEDLNEWTESAGADQVEFLIRANKGEAIHPIAKVASGGELSRLMLAIRRVIANKGGIGVYLFDEIDAGIGGQTAFEVGRKLKSVSKYNQVICITHLAQIASFASHHLSVEKSVKGQRTITRIVELETAGRKEEIARMLGGPKLTPNSLKNAEDIMKAAGAN